jgi:Spy/CpxP family protein refolding chaperone
MKAVVVVLALCLGVTTAIAQPRPAGPPGADRRDEIRKEIKKKIAVMRAATLQQELNLDDATLAKILPVLSKWDDVTEKLLIQRVDLTKRLKQADQLRDPKAIDRLVDDALANQRAFRDLEDKRLAELRRILTPAQTAKLLIVLPEFERKIMNQLRRAMNKRPGAGPPGAVDDDDDLEPDEPPRRR